MSLYRVTIARSGADHQVIVHWDDHDPNRHIVAPITVSGEITEERLAGIVGSMGFRIASEHSDNVGRGWAIVSRLRQDHPFYNPLDSGWYAYLSDDVKRQIRAKYPEADVPGVH